MQNATISREDIKPGKQAWGDHYKTSEHPHNYYPESFIARVFLSKQPVEFINTELTGKSIIDLGCGHGRHLPFLTSLGLNVTGLEVTKKQIALLQERFIHDTFYLGECANIPARDDTFDYALACNSIYYLNDRQSKIQHHIEEVHRVLKKGGILIVSLVGHQHSILQNCEVLSNGNAVINEDFLGFRTNTVMRPLWDGESIVPLIAPFFEVLKSGEILEKSEGFTRHLHYFTLHKR